MISVNRKTVTVCVSIFVVAVVSTGVAFSANKQPVAQTQVKDASTSQTSDTQKNESASLPAPITSETAAPASQGAGSTRTSSTPATPAATSPANPTPSTPPPNNQPAPQPTYHVFLRDDEAYTQSVAEGIEQLIVPFDVVYDAGFTPTNVDMPDCLFVVAPIVDHQVLCNVSEKNRGHLGMQYDDTSAPGHYEVQLTYSIDGVVRTDAIEFDLN